VSDQSQPQFLDKRNYRRKRLIDAARLLPILGAALLVFPLPFLFLDSVSSDRAATMALYLFGVWLVLIIAAGLLVPYLRSTANDD
jgi:hypothetical protein